MYFTVQEVPQCKKLYLTRGETIFSHLLVFTMVDLCKENKDKL